MPQKRSTESDDRRIESFAGPRSSVAVSACLSLAAAFGVSSLYRHHGEMVLPAAAAALLVIAASIVMQMQSVILILRDGSTRPAVWSAITVFTAFVAFVGAADAQWQAVALGMTGTVVGSVQFSRRGGPNANTASPTSARETPERVP